MTALGEQLAASGYFPNTTTADLAITAGQVVRDSNGQIRVAGSSTAIEANVQTKGTRDTLTLLPGGDAPPKKGSGNNKW
jgi:hypothetical protein